MAKPEAQREQLDELAWEFADRWRRGECPTVSEYAGKYTELAHQIHELFPTIAAVERLKLQNVLSRGGPASLRGAHLERLGDLRIIREIGRGGMGIVYEAEQESLGRRVAIKVLPKHSLLDPVQLKRFHREARIAARLEHPNIVTIFGVGQHDGFHYLIMQLIRGVGLDKIVARLARGRRSEVAGLETETFVAAPTAGGQSQENRSAYWRSITRIGLQAAGALHYAHLQGTVHCDIKPANLLVDPEGFLWIADFGVAKAVQFDKVTRTGDVTGTLQYMAPERFQGQTDARSDVYSLGMTLYELVTLRSPYSDGNREGVVRRILEQSPTSPRRLNAAIPHDLETIVLKAIARNPGQRYQSAGELAEDLRRYLDERPIKARRATWADRSWQWCRRNPITAGLAALVAVLTTLLVLLSSNVQAPPQPAPNAEQPSIGAQSHDWPLAEGERPSLDFRRPPAQFDPDAGPRAPRFDLPEWRPGEADEPPGLDSRNPMARGRPDDRFGPGPPGPRPSANDDRPRLSPRGPVHRPAGGAMRKPPPERRPFGQPPGPPQLDADYDRPGAPARDLPPRGPEDDRVGPMPPGPFPGRAGGEVRGQ